MSDQLRKYLFADKTVRAQTVFLREAWEAIQANHDYPPAISQLLGELVAASVLMSGNLKFDGSLVFQLQGDGDVRLIVVECRANLELRATVKLREGATLPAEGGLQALLNPGGTGRFAVILDPLRKLPGQQPYQGIVPLVGDTVASALEHYMAHSEQLQTRIWLEANPQAAAGLLLQQLPLSGGNAPTATDGETWNRSQQLAGTLQPGELLATDSETLIHRLFWEEDLLVFEPQAARFHCGCDREKVVDVLRLLGQPEIDSILAEQDEVTVNCDYCTREYAFDRVDCAEIFASDAPAGLRHQSPSQH